MLGADFRAAVPAGMSPRVYKQTVRADGFLGLSKAAVKAQDRIRKAVNTRSQSWNTASPVPTATIEEF